MLVLASQASVALVAVLLRLWYGYENARRERKALAVGALPEKRDQAWLNREFFPRLGTCGRGANNLNSYG